MQPKRRRHDGLSDLQFQRVATLLSEYFGIELPERKRETISRRLRRLYSEGEYSSFDDFFSGALGSPPEMRVLSELIDKASTNHTYFWREPEHFRLFSARVLPDLERRLAAERDLRIWCAAAATGEEPVTLAMLTQAHFGFRSREWNLGVLATDISASALAHARRGVWRQDNVQRLPIELRRAFSPAGQGLFKLDPQIAKELTWRRLNLVAQSYPFRRAMHVVFCRNVLIYFDKETTDHVLQRIHQVLEPGGWLFLSHSETIGRDSIFEYVQPGVYRRRLP